MEIWMIWTFVSVFIGGLYHFTSKVIAERNYSVHQVNSLGHLVAILVTGFLLFLSGDSDIFFGDTLLIIAIFASLNGIFYIISIFTRVGAMKNIDTVIFYPIYKTLGPIIVTCISIFFFEEILTTKEVLGILVGICIPLLLITKKEQIIQKNISLGLILTALTALLTAVASTFSKLVQTQDLTVEVFVLIALSVGGMFSWVLYIRELKSPHKKTTSYNKEGVVFFGLITGVLHASAFYAFVKALEGNLAIVFTINSFSILIPIILYKL